MADREDLKLSIKQLQAALESVDTVRSSLQPIFQSIALSCSSNANDGGQQQQQQATEESLKVYRSTIQLAFQSIQGLKENHALAASALEKGRNSFMSDNTNVSIKKRSRPNTLGQVKRVVRYTPVLDSPKDRNTFISFCSTIADHLSDINLSPEEGDGLPGKLKVKAGQVLQAELKLRWFGEVVKVEDLLCVGPNETISWHVGSSYLTYQKISAFCRASVTQSLSSEQCNLEEILALLNSYSTLLTSPCSKNNCKKVLSSRHLPPFERHYIGASSGNKGDWSAFHGGCLDLLHEKEEVTLQKEGEIGDEMQVKDEMEH